MKAENQALFQAGNDKTLRYSVLRDQPLFAPRVRGSSLKMVWEIQKTAKAVKWKRNEKHAIKQARFSVTGEESRSERVRQ